MFWHEWKQQLDLEMTNAMLRHDDHDDAVNILQLHHFICVYTLQGNVSNATNVSKFYEYNDIKWKTILLQDRRIWMIFFVF